ncbi:MAG: FtsQ-type POTRA domain-containing protein [Treponema sp.]|jgi:cell division protein FtsQ|nr:FtsQ-type POTRA domain-containing protein [Treponema sp.]
MSGEFIYSASSSIKKDLMPEDDVLEIPVQEGTELEAEENQKAAGLEKGIKVLIIAAASVLVLEFLWIFVISPCMPLSRLEVAGFSGLDRKELLRQAGIGERASYISVNPRSVEKNLGAIRELESVRVTKRFPNSVTILLVPRTAVAMAFGRTEGRQTPLYFDRHGVLFNAGSSLSRTQPPQDLGLPVISGLPLEDDKPLPAIYLPLFASLDKIRGAEPRLLQAISEIRVNRKPFDGFDLVLYPVHSPIRVRLEPNLSEETLRYVMLMLDVFAEREREIEEIDFRTETASYRLKEVPSD